MKALNNENEARMKKEKPNWSLYENPADQKYAHFLQKSSLLENLFEPTLNSQKIARSVLHITLNSPPMSCSQKIADCWKIHWRNLSSTKMLHLCNTPANCAYKADINTYNGSLLKALYKL